MYSGKNTLMIFFPPIDHDYCSLGATCSPLYYYVVFHMLLHFLAVTRLANLAWPMLDCPYLSPEINDHRRDTEPVWYSGQQCMLH